MGYIAICEDIPEHGAHLRRAVEAALGPAGPEIACCRDPEGLRELLARRGLPDVLLMDIHYQDGDGVSAVAELLPANARTQVIFVTGYIENCVRVYEVPHVYFLTKPVDGAPLRKALAAAFRKLDALAAATLTVKLRDGVRQLRLDDILYLESRRRLVFLHTRGRSLETYAKLDELAARAGGGFVRCHQSFCVNLDFVRDLTSRRFRLYDGREIPISQRRYAEAKDAFLRHMARRNREGAW